MNYITEYTLNFVIPMGSTGPVAPTFLTKRIINDRID